LDGTLRTPAGVFPIDPKSIAYRYDRNPSHIEPHDVNLTFDALPQAATSPRCVTFGATGISLTGNAIYHGASTLGNDAATTNPVLKVSTGAYGGALVVSSGAVLEAASLERIELAARTARHITGHGSDVAALAPQVPARAPHDLRVRRSRGRAPARAVHRLAAPEGPEGRRPRAGHD
jgi:hypothetical protein